MEKYTLQIIEVEGGELVIEFPPELVDSLGWKIGDEITFLHQDDNNSFVIKKIVKEDEDGQK